MVTGRVSGEFSRAATVFVLLLACGGIVPRALAQRPDPNQGPGGPILVITSSSTYGKYYAEILRTEGLNEFAVTNLASVTSATLNSCDVAILAPGSLTAAQVSMFTSWVNAGGNLIAMQPDAQLGSLLGITPTGSTLSNSYLAVDTTTIPGNGIVGQPIQFHGTANGYTLNGASPIATLYTNPATPTSNPAVTLRTVGTGGGHAAAFAYDLATSIVYTRQGNPAWAAQERDGTSPIRSDDKFYGSATGDPQPDWVDLNNQVSIPQADEQQRLLANIIAYMNIARKPLPRFWYFPRGFRAVVVMSGDDHANGGTSGRFDQYIAASPANCNVANWDCIRSTSYIYVEPQNLSAAQAASYTAKGFEVGLHINTNCADFTPASLDTFYSQQIATFTSTYNSSPAPLTMRHHCIAWSDWVSGAKTQLKYGIRLDTSYYFWPPSWVQNRPGHFTGSAMPMRFADLDGTLIDVYNLPSQMTDESGQAYPFTSDALLSAAVGSQGYYGAYTVNAHTDSVSNPVSDGVVSSALARGVPIVSGAQMLNWLDARNSSAFGGLTWNGTALTFTVSPGPGANGLQAMVPVRSSTGLLTTITGPSGNVATTINTIKGVDYAFFTAAAGSYTATYAADTTRPTVISTTPANGATSVLQSVAVTATFSEALNPSTVNSTTAVLRDPANNTVPAAISYTAATHVVTLTPTAPLATSTTFTVTLTTGMADVAGNALASNYIWSFTTTAGPSCPCSAWSSSATPATPSVNDPNAVELGVNFRVDLNGFITGIRFYKGTGNTGTHVGNLWNSAGQLLASATFSNETPSGWQQVSFSAPVAVTANTVYVASYHTNTGNYAGDNSFFAASGVDNYPVHLLKDGVSGGNGVYAYGPSSLFPTNTYASSNYWVDVVFTTSTTDTTPPVISSVTATPGSTSATIVWTTNEASTSRVDYGTSASSLTLTANNGTLVTSHSISLSGLTAGTTYYYRVTSVDAANNSATAPASPAAPASFTTTAVDNTPPVISGINATPASSSAQISWTTNEPATSRVDFGLTTSLGSNVADATLVTSHTLTITGLTPGTTYNYRVTSVDAANNSAASPTAPATLTFTTTSAVVSNIFGNATPATPSDTDVASVELGMKFRSDVDGTVTGVRFYKSVNNTGVHTGSLWTSTGSLLATVTFAGETASGWQQANFSSPVPITAGTIYVVSYHAPNGRYAADAGYFTSTGLYNPPLYALRNGVSGANGVYLYGSGGFPNQTFSSSNYYVDVVFSAPATTAVRLFPAATVIESGTPGAGTFSALTADDNTFYQVNSTTSGTRTSAWYGSFTGVPNSLTGLAVSYVGKNSATCTEALSVWNFTTSAWVQINSTSVGTGEVLRSNIVPGGTLSDYVSGASGPGEVRVRVSCSTASTSFTSSGDLMSITYTP